MTHTIVMGIPFVIAPALPSRPTLSAAIAANTPPMASRRLICAAGGFVGCIRGSMQIARQERFVYHQSMNVEDHADAAVSRIAAAIGELARARMLYCLVDGRARTSTELAIVADVTPSTASVHLQRLKSQRLVKVFAQGKHRYYSLEGANVAVALESLSVLAGGSPDVFVPNTPNVLRAARTCYDHIAGTLVGRQNSSTPKIWVRYSNSSGIKEHHRGITPGYVQSAFFCFSPRPASAKFSACGPRQDQSGRYAVIRLPISRPIRRNRIYHSACPIQIKAFVAG